MITLDIRPLQDRQRSGVGYYTAHIVDALVQRARHRYALFGNAAHINEVDLPFGFTTEKKLFRIPNKILNAAWATLGIPTIEQLIPNTKLTYLPNLNFFASNKPYIVTVHDLSFEHFPEFFSPKQRAWHGAIRPKKILHNAAHIVAVSEHTKNDLSETYGMTPSKISVVSPGVDEQFLPQSEETIIEVKKQYALPEQFILFLGTVEPRKNTLGLIEAYEKSGIDAELVIAGGDGWQHKKVYHRIAISPRSAHIHPLGYISERDRPALYSAARAFVYPSFYEGFGMPVLEAMACGTPVIASHTSSLGEVVGDAGMLINPHRHDELVTALQTMVSDDALHAQLCRQSLLQSKKFSWERSAELLEKVFAKF